MERKKKNLEIYGIQEQLLTLKYKYQYEAINRLLSRTQEVVGIVEIKSTVDGKIENVTANKKGTSIKYGDLLCQVVQEESLSVLAVDEGLDALLYQPVTIDVYGKTDVEVKGKVVYANATFQRQLISKQFVFNPPKDISNIAYIELENKSDFDKIGSQFGIELQLHKVTKGIMIKKDDIYKDYAPIKINEATGSKESDGRAYVWVREENGYKKQYIKVGYSDSKYAWIIYGLEVGQEIATNVKG